MSITIMGKTIGKSDAQQEEEFLRKASAKEKKENRRLAKMELERELARKRETFKLQNEQRKAVIEQARRERERKRLETQKQIESEKAGIQAAKARQAIYTKQRRASSGLGSLARGTKNAIVGVNKGLVTLAGGRPSKRLGTGKPRRRVLYESTSHGLKRVSDGGVYGASALPTSGKVPPRIKSDDDDWGQAGAFSGF